MSTVDTSVAAILKELGKPVEAMELVDVVARKRNVGKKQAYRLIKKAWKDGEIRKIPLPDRRVLYALPEWSISKDFQDVFYYFSLKELEQIAYENVYGRHMRAFQRLRHLIARQPQALQHEMNPMLQKIIAAIEEALKKGLTYEQRQEVLREATLGLSLIHISEPTRPY